MHQFGIKIDKKQIVKRGGWGMKKSLKRLYAIVLSLLICVSTLTINSYAVTYQDKANNTLYVAAKRNDKGEWKNLTKTRIEVLDMSSISVQYTGKASITVKSSKAALNAKVTSSSFSKYSNWDESTKTYLGNSSATIGLYATKNGTYSVTITATKPDGSSVSKSVSILVTNQSGVYKTAKLGKKTIYSEIGKTKSGQLTKKASALYKVSAKTGKLKLTPNTKYKITGLVVTSVNAKGKASIKKINNGKKITLSRGYNYKSSDAFDGTSYKSSKKITNIYVSYKDTFTGSSVTYTVTTKRGKKEIMRTYKDGVTGDKDVTYFNGESGSTLSLWSY